MKKEKLDTLSLEELKDFVWDKVKKQDESIEQVRDVMLWRTKEFKTMRVEWEIQHEKVKAMDKYLADYIITTDETHGKDMQWRDEKIESQSERIKELEAEVKLENENKRSQHVNLCLQIEDLEKDCKELADVIRGLDPTNPILQNLIL